MDFGIIKIGAEISTDDPVLDSAMVGEILIRHWERKVE